MSKDANSNNDHQPDSVGSVSREVIPPDPSFTRRRRTRVWGQRLLLIAIALAGAMYLSDVRSLGDAVAIFDAVHTVLPFLLITALLWDPTALVFGLLTSLISLRNWDPKDNLAAPNSKFKTFEAEQREAVHRGPFNQRRTTSLSRRINGLKDKP